MDRTTIQEMMEKYPDTDVVQTFGKSLLEVMEQLEAATMGQGEDSSPGSSEEVAELHQELDKHIKDVQHQAPSDGPTEDHPCRCDSCTSDKKTALARSWDQGQKALLRQFDEAAVAEGVEGARDVVVQAFRKHHNGSPDKSGITDDALASIMGQ